MPKMQIERPTDAHAAVTELIDSVTRRMRQGSLGACPVEFAHVVTSACATQSCGKCTPCRVGLRQLDLLLGSVLDGKATEDTVKQILSLAKNIYLSADCAIGYEAGASIARVVERFYDDFVYHATHGGCNSAMKAAVPCREGCPAHVDIPGYIALIRAGRCQDAVKLIRKDNPFVLTCGLVCEHPCELSCRRGFVDDPINVRALKRYAAENSQNDYTPFHHEPTGKKVAIIGGGPAGLTAAYYLALMGHSPVVYEKHAELGGMMRYGIPSYRLPREELNEEIEFLLKQGIEVKCGVSIPNDISLTELQENYDAVFVAIGAHKGKQLNIPGEDARGVLSAIELLGAKSDKNYSILKGKRVAVVGGGNVAMDAARSSVRYGAKSVQIVYRRRIDDMTAQRIEVDGAIAEGCEIMDLNTPIEVMSENGEVVGLKIQPQMAGEIQNGRPKPKPSHDDAFVLPVDVIIVAAGQNIDYEPFEKAGIQANRGRLISDEFAAVANMPGVFLGGECESGPATVIRAVAAGKVAARNIDTYLGYNHEISVDVDVPPAVPENKTPMGRINNSEKGVPVRTDNFDSVEHGLSQEKALQEASRCLRCDCCGMGGFRGGRIAQW